MLPRSGCFSAARGGIAHLVQPSGRLLMLLRHATCFIDGEGICGQRHPSFPKWRINTKEPALFNLRLVYPIEIRWHPAYEERAMVGQVDP